MMESQNNNDIRTLFIRGLPEDVGNREVLNLLRFIEGFEGLTFNEKNRTSAFAVWKDKEYAYRAMNLLNGQYFDMITNSSILSVNFAKNNPNNPNLRLIRVEPRHSKAFKIPNHSETSNDIHEDTQHKPRVLEQGGPGMPLVFHSKTNSIVQKEEYNPRNVQNMLYGLGLSVKKKGSFSRSIPPCSTLFVSNLSSQTTVRDVLKLFSQLEGYETMKFQTGVGESLVCFVQFDSIENATSAMSMFQKFNLKGLKMKISYAKSKMKHKNNPERFDELNTYDDPNYMEDFNEDDEGNVDDHPVETNSNVRDESDNWHIEDNED